MKVRDLIQLLRCEEQDLEVYVQVPTHDHWRTLLAREPVIEDNLWVSRDGYYGGNAVYECDDEGMPEGAIEAIVIRGGQS